MSRVVAICGMPGSGKGVFGEVAKELGLPVRSMGDQIRAEVDARGLAGDPHVFGRVALELREEFGDQVLADRLAPVVEADLQNNTLVIIEGMRGVAERDIFVQYWGDDFGILSISASAEERFQRISARGRAEDGNRSTFTERDERELGWGLGELILGSSWELTNEGGLDAFRVSCGEWLNSMLP